MGAREIRICGFTIEEWRELRVPHPHDFWDGIVGGRRDVDAAAAALAGPDAEAAALAAFVLGHAQLLTDHAEPAVPLLERALAASDEAVRAEAAASLVTLCRYLKRRIASGRTSRACSS